MSEDDVTVLYIEDEDHYFLHCRINNQPRNLLFNIIGNYCSNFVNMYDLNKLKYILNPNPDLSSDICTFIKQSSLTIDNRQYVLVLTHLQ
jgi:translation elongation factor EF-Ts